jgi:hypothetical protein
VTPTTTTTTGPPASAGLGASGYQLPAALGNTRPYWLLESFSVPALLGAGLPSTLLKDYFDNPQTFLIVKAANPAQNPMLPNATYVMSFGNYQLLLYDNERWPATPAVQQQQPFSYEAQAQTLAHQHGLGLIFTPAANLSMVLSPAYTNATKYDGYTSLGIAGQAAPHADVLDIQAQQDEGTSGFGSFVASAVSQARTANPHALLMVGLTTTAPRQDVTAQVLLNDYAATRAAVSGYWLNVPGGAGGPRDPEVAVAFLQALAPQLGY